MRKDFSELWTVKGLPTGNDEGIGGLSCATKRIILQGRCCVFAAFEITSRFCQQRLLLLLISQKTLLPFLIAHRLLSLRLSHRLQQLIETSYLFLWRLVLLRKA